MNERKTPDGLHVTTSGELRALLKKTGTLDMPVYFETWDASNLVVLSVYESNGAIHIDVGGLDDGLLDDADDVDDFYDEDGTLWEYAHG